MKRREFLKNAGACASALALSAYPRASFARSPHIRNSRISNRTIVLGMDGVDPKLLRRFMAEGHLPTFKRFCESNHFSELQTTMPPQSPVAWASFISGCNPGGHGIFDFIHRDPRSFTPYLSTSRSYEAGRSMKLGRFNLPLGSGRVDLMRRGPAFWRYLEDLDIDTTVYQIPSNFPTEEGQTKAISGMGTPDLLGGYGTCSLFTDAPDAPRRDFDGGRILRVKAINHVLKGRLEGPPNPFYADSHPTSVDIEVRRDPSDPVARIKIQDTEIILKQGEWSEWIPLRFELLSVFAGVSGMVRILLQQVHPYFKMYISPINIDPQDASLPICSPASYSREISQIVGRFYTQGLPADTKALSNGILSDDDYLSQAQLVIAENMRSYKYLLDNFHEGMFFYYFSSIDQNCHMLWRNMDPSHPLYVADATPEVKGGVLWFYKRMDDALRMALEKVDSRTTFMVVSDHGFVPFRREFHLSTWLAQNGYVAFNHGDPYGEAEFFKHVDWSRTTAYALGINGIYVNVKGREPHGVVEPHDAERIKSEIIQKLSQVVDPLNGHPVVSRCFDSRKIYSGPHMECAPDLQVGYAAGYRVSDEAILGKFPRGIIENRTNKWSADHCMDPAVVPGIFLANKPCLAPSPGLWDMAPTILKSFGIDTPAAMDGKPVLEV